MQRIAVAMAEVDANEGVLQQKSRTHTLCSKKLGQLKLINSIGYC